MAWVADEDALLAFDGADWVTAAAAAALQNVPMLGVNATADATNLLTLASAASLFDHAGAGHQQKINKAAAGDTASQLYQSNASGRAELGLVGDDDFHVKVSADGSAWHEAVVIDKDTGRIGLGTHAPTSRVTVSENAVAPPSAATGTLTHLVQADGVSCRFFLDAFASNAQLNFRRANGSNASRVALASGNSIGRFSVFGYGATGFSSTSRGGLNIVATEDWTDTAQGTRLDLLAVPNGAAVEGIALTALGNGNVRVGSDATAACKLDVDGPVRVKGYTVAGVPSAAAAAGQIIYVSDEFERRRAGLLRREQLAPRHRRSGRQLIGPTATLDFGLSGTARGVRRFSDRRVRRPHVRSGDAHAARKQELWPCGNCGCSRLHSASLGSVSRCAAGHRCGNVRLLGSRQYSGWGSLGLSVRI